MGSLQLSFQLQCIQKILVQIPAYTSLEIFQKFALKMASEIRIGGNKYQLSTSSGGGQYYYIQTESPGTSVQQSNGEQFIVSDLSDIGEEAIIMFEEEGGVGAEEFVTCFVDSSQVGEGSGYQPIIVTSADQLGMVEEEVTTEIIKSEIQVDDDSSHFQIKNESVEYENGLDMKKVIVTKSNYEQPLNLVKKKSNGKISVIPQGAELVICKLCNSYVVASKIDVHNRDMHGESTADRLTCPDCGKLFTSKRSLVGHKKEKHSGTLEIFPCQHCGKNFSRKSNLKAHMDSIHFGKKFPCSYCERIFTNRGCMNLHVKKIHSETLYNL